MAAPASAGRPALPSPLLLLGLVTAAWLVLFLARILSPFDLLAWDQQRVASYVLDAVHNGNWICQRDFREEVSSKPPMFTWLAAAATVAWGRIDRFTLCFPSALATLLLAWLVLAVGSRHLGRGTGFWGALACLLCASGLKQVLLARTDPLFGLAVFGTLALGHRAWVRGSGWTGAWLAAAAATLTKGPLGPLFAAAGLLLARLWGKRGGEGHPIRGSQVPGILLFVAITAGWLALAERSLGGSVFERLIGQELVGHSVLPRGGRYPGERAYDPAISFLVSSLPWSLAACAGFWRVARRPSAAPETRRFERLLFAFFFAGLVLLSLGVHQRRDLVFPLLPAAALLGGREIARRVPPGGGRRFRVLLFGVPAGLLAVLVADLLAVDNRTDEVQQTRWCRELARRVEDSVGRAFPLVHVNTPTAVQFYLDTDRSRVSAERAARLLEQPEKAFVAVRDGALAPEERRLLEGAGIHEVGRWPQGERPFLRILANHPRLEATPLAAMVSGPLYLRMENLRLIEDHEGGFVLAPTGGAYAVQVTNEGSEPRRVHVAIEATPDRKLGEPLLQPGETWSARGAASAPEEPRPWGESARGVLGAGAFLVALLALLLFLAARTRRVLAASEEW